MKTIHNSSIIQGFDQRGREASCLEDIHLLVEMTDFCNERCIMCRQAYEPTMHGQTPKKFMEVELFKKIIEDLKAKRIKISSFDPLWLGESMLHPQFKDMLKFLFNQNLEHNLFRGFVLNTNATLMDEEITDIFLDYANRIKNKKDMFLRLFLSLDAAKPATYAKIKNVPPTMLVKAQANIATLIRKRNERGLVLPNLIFIFIVMPQNRFEAKGFLSSWKTTLAEKSGVPFEITATWPLATDRDAIYLRQLISATPDKAAYLHQEVCRKLGLIPADRHEKGSPKIHRISRTACRALWRSPNITSDGRLTPCCRDINLELEIGNIRYQALDEIWQGEPIRQLRIAHLKGNLESYPICARCTEPEGGMLSEEETLQCCQELDIKLVTPTTTSVGRRLNICLVSREYPPETAWGGIGTYTHHLAHGLAKLGHRVHVIAQSLGAEYDTQDQGVLVHRLKHPVLFPGKFLLNEFRLRLEYSQRVAGKIRNLMQSEALDIVEGPNLAAETFVYSLGKKTPLVTRIHTPFSEVLRYSGTKRSMDNGLSCWLENATILASELVLCSTQNHRDKMLSDLGLEPKRLDIIPLGIPLPLLIQQGEDRQQENNANVLYVGRLESRKGIHILLKAIPDIVRLCPTAQFTIIGRDTFATPEGSSVTGAAHQSFKTKILETFPKELLGRVHFLDHLNSAELNRAYSACDLFVAPSLYESFGFIYLEAMSFAKPVLGCRTGGVPEVVLDNECGLLVEPADAKGLADAIVRLLKSPDERKRMGQEARKRVELYFTQARLAENTAAAYQSLLDI
ncbi:MAG: glycosyltransferase [Candidatus Omnitrophota bacterium]